MREVGVYVGRFNPIHKSHMRTVGEMKNNHGRENCLLILGSTNQDISIRYMFTAKERQIWIQTLYPLIKIIGQPDMKSDSDWLWSIQQAISLAFDGAVAIPQDWADRASEDGQYGDINVTFYSGSYEDSQYYGSHTVEVINRFDAEYNISGTEIRDRLIYGKSIENLVHGSILKSVENTFKIRWEELKRI